MTAGPLCSQTHDWVLWGSITEAGAALTPPAVSRVGIKIWHPQQSSIDTSWAWSQRKCLSPPLSTPPFSLRHGHKCLSPFTPENFSYISSFSFFSYGVLPSPSSRSHSPMRPSSASASLEFPSQPLCPNFPLFSLLPLANPFQWHNTDFLPTFLPSWASVSVAQ